MAPPLEKHAIANQFEPWGELQVRVDKHALEFLCCDVLGVLHLVWIGVDVDVGPNEKDVVDYGFSTSSVMCMPLSYREEKAHSRVLPIYHHSAQGSEFEPRIEIYQWEPAQA
jgi:hypothetical protein